MKDFKQGGKAWNEMLACLTAIDGDEQMTVELKQQVVWCSGFGKEGGVKKWCSTESESESDNAKPAFRCAGRAPQGRRALLSLQLYILVRSKAATSITIPQKRIVVHTPDPRSPSSVRVRGCRLVRCTSKVTHTTTRNVQRTSESAPGSGVAFRAA